MNAAIMSGLGLISGVAKQISAKKEQSDYRASANVGDPFFKPGVERIKPPQRTDSASYGPGTPSQTFSKRSCAKGEDMYGSEQQRAMSMPPLLELDPMYNGEAGVQKEDITQF